MNIDSSSPSQDPQSEENVSTHRHDSSEIGLWDFDEDQNTNLARSDNSEGSVGKLPIQRGFTAKIHNRKPADLRPSLAETDKISKFQSVSAEADDLTPTEPAVSDPVSKEPNDKIAQESAYVSTTELAKKAAAKSGLDADFEANMKITNVQREAVDKEAQEARKVDPAPTVQRTLPAILSTNPLFKIEKIAILLLCFFLLSGAAFTLNHFSNRIPTRSLFAEKIDFPVSGKIVTITAASTYWRKPITSGDNADIIRRNTQIIPVVNLSLSSKTGAIRVFFRNEEDLLVGDVITRSVAGDSEITVIATAGFDDLGMHTAYRTGSGKRWRAQVFEAPSATASREDFSMVLEMEIDTQIR